MSLLTTKNIIVPWDYSEMSKSALDTAMELAASPNQIKVVHVIPYPPSMEPGVVWGSVDEMGLSENAKQSFQRDYTDPKYQDIQFKVLFGDPGSQIASYAKDVDAGMVVISSHGRTGLAHFFLGSVAEKVTRLAPCPVLVLRKPK